MNRRTFFGALTALIGVVKGLSAKTTQQAAQSKPKIVSIPVPAGYYQSGALFLYVKAERDLTIGDMIFPFKNTHRVCRVISPIKKGHYGHVLICGISQSMNVVEVHDTNGHRHDVLVFSQR